MRCVNPGGEIDVLYVMFDIWLGCGWCSSHCIVMPVEASMRAVVIGPDDCVTRHLIDSQS